MRDEILTLQDVAKYLKMSERTIYGYAQQGKLPGIKVGAAWRFRKADLDNWLEERLKQTQDETSRKNRKEKE